MVDANQQWTLPCALAMVPVLQEANVFWVEEPTHVADIHAHAELKRAMPGINIACTWRSPLRDTRSFPTMDVPNW